MHLVISTVVCLVMMTSLGSCADCRGPKGLFWQWGSGPGFSQMGSRPGFMGGGFGPGFMGRGFGPGFMGRGFGHGFMGRLFGQGFMGRGFDHGFRRWGRMRFGSFWPRSLLDVDGILSQMDTNNDNEISITEDRNSLSLFDTSKDGTITRGEFVNRMFNEFCYPKMLATYLFDEIDINQDDVLTNDGDILASNFDANGNADVSTVRQQLRQADRNVHVKDRKYKRLFDMIQQQYDGQ